MLRSAFLALDIENMRCPSFKFGEGFAFKTIAENEVSNRKLKIASER
jgi:hypothetical protein